MRNPDRFPRLFLILFAVLAAGLSGAAPAAAQDTVTGTFTVGGKTYDLAYVNVRRQPSANEKRMMVVVVLLTDKPVPKKVLEDKYRLDLTDMAREGRIHGVSVTLGGDKKPAETGWTYAKEFGGAIVNRADQHSFEGKVLDESHAEGKLSGHGTFGSDTWEYSATFKATIGVLK